MSEMRREGAAPTAPSSAPARTFERSPAELKDVIAAERIGHPFLVWRDTAGHQQILAAGPGHVAGHDRSRP